VKHKHPKGPKRRPDEMFAFGPIRVARFGRVTVIQSNLTPDERRRFRENLPKVHAETEAALRNQISRVLELVRKYDSLELFAFLLMKHGIMNPVTYVESESATHEYLAEYVLSVVTAMSETDLSSKAPSDDTEAEVETAVEEVFSSARTLIMYEPREKPQAIDEFRVQMFLRHLMMRGESYPDHHLDLIRALGEPHDRYLSAKYGFTTSELIDTFGTVGAQIVARLSAFIRWIAEVKTIQAEAFRTMERDGGRLEDAVSEESRRRVVERHSMLVRNGRELLRIEMADPKICGAVVKTCASALGENSPFLADPFAGHPSKDTIIWRKPLLQLGGAYYCPSPALLNRSGIEVIDGLLSQEASYADKYRTLRAATLERLALSFLGRLLPDAITQSDLYYTTTDGVRAQTDGVLVLDRFVLVVEAKAGGLSLPARRGAPGRLRHDFEKIIEEAFLQGTRVREHILGQNAAQFADAAGRIALAIKRADVDEVYIIIPTLAVMDPLGAQLALARDMGLLSHGGGHWPWCVFINDLRIISELIESPSEFLLFLQRRLVAHSAPYAPHDELDLLCKFFSDGLYQEKGELKGITRMGLHGYMDMLDRWYLGRPHGAVVQKPGRQVPPEIRDLVRAIERTGASRRTAAAIRILELDQPGLERIQAFLATCRRECATDAIPHDLSIQFRDPVRGISFYVSKEGRLDSHAVHHAIVRRQLTRAEEWLAIAVPAVGGGAEFRFIQPFDTFVGMDLAIARIRRERLAEFVEQHARAPARNAPCSCGSDRKFKVCCGLLGDTQ
jgi:hypothetical protein